MCNDPKSIIGKPVIAFVTLAQTADGELWAVDPAAHDPRLPPGLIHLAAQLIRQSVIRGV